MRLIRTKFPEVVILQPTIYEDERGSFMESFNERKFHDAMQDLGLSIPHMFVQDNHSISKKGVLRGLHFQLPPYAQGKLVRVVRGSVYDVVVDIREGSPTFGEWMGLELNTTNNHALWIPEGFAHGFLSLENDTHFLYKTTNFYNKASEASICWNDPTIAIDWPRHVSPILNEKDTIASNLVDITKMPYTQSILANSELINLKSIGDQRGHLVSLESARSLPFDLKRVYYIFDTKAGINRGFHAHKRLQQLAVCVSGRCRMVLDDGKVREEIWLDSPTKALLINKMIWREMHDFSDNCVLVVFASNYYDEADYIRDYEDFMRGVSCE
jgi:dTDP-4-dehydrorhamnose 3,5-epimerase